MNRPNQPKGFPMFANAWKILNSNEKCLQALFIKR